jgi:Trypsin
MKAVAALAPLFVVACASGQAEDTAREAQPIIHGEASDASQDAVVLVMRYESGKPATLGGCSGTLLAPKLVLTARHCVASTDETSACASDGTPISGGKVHANVAPNAMYVFPGATRPDLIGGDVSRAALGAEILDDGGGTLCDHDIALIVLDRPIPGAQIAPVRLDGATAKGEALTSVGWGYTETTAQPDARQQRRGVSVTAVGPSTRDGLSARELMTGESICQGDSGGPLFAASGAVVALASRGGNGATSPPDSCIGADNIFTMTAGFKDFLLAGYARAGQEPWPEGGPNPLLTHLGGACASNAGCQSNLCDDGICTSDCDAAACPAAFTCENRNGKRECVAAGDLAPGGCNVGAARAFPGWAALAALLVVFGRLRRPQTRVYSARRGWQRPQDPAGPDPTPDRKRRRSR